MPLSTEEQAELDLLNTELQKRSAMQSGMQSSQSSQSSQLTSQPTSSGLSPEEQTELDLLLNEQQNRAQGVQPTQQPTQQTGNPIIDNSRILPHEQDELRQIDEILQSRQLEQQKIDEQAAQQQTYDDYLESDIVDPNLVPQDQFNIQRPEKESTLGEKIEGGIETVRSLLTGATTGSIGFVYGIVDGIKNNPYKIGTPEFAQHVEQSAVKNAGRGTYIPKTEEGRKYTQFVGEALEPLAALGPVAGGIAAEARIAGQGIKQAGATGLKAADVARQVSRDIPGTIIGETARQKIVAPIVNEAGLVREALRPVEQFGKQAAISAAEDVVAFTNSARNGVDFVGQILANTPVGTRVSDVYNNLVNNRLIRRNTVTRDASERGSLIGDDSASAAAVSAEQLRAERAANLPVPVDLSRGQRTKDFAQTQFEKETAKNAIVGEPLREFGDTQNLKLQQNIEKMIDDNDSQNYTRYDIGLNVSNVLDLKAQKLKKDYNKLYEIARKEGVMEKEKVNLSDVSIYLNTNRAGRSEASIMNKAQRQLEVLEIAEGDFVNNNLKINPTNINKVEDFRRFINKNINQNDPNDVRIGAEIIDLIDGGLNSVNNIHYKKARKAYSKYVNEFKNRAIVKDLMETKKGSNDRKVAYENVIATIAKADVDSLNHLKKIILRKDGRRGSRLREGGEQAWKDIQTGVLEEIRDSFLRNTQRDSKGNIVPSPVGLRAIITKLDKDGKLDIIFGKKQADDLRLLADVAEDVLTSAAGTVNFSNTTSALINYLDLTASAVAGVPLPAGSATDKILRSILKNTISRVKDRKLRKRVKDALEPYRRPGESESVVQQAERAARESLNIPNAAVVQQSNLNNIQVQH